MKESLISKIKFGIGAGIFCVGTTAMQIKSDMEERKKEKQRAKQEKRNAQETEFYRKNGGEFAVELAKKVGLIH